MKKRFALFCGLPVALFAFAQDAPPAPADVAAPKAEAAVSEAPADGEAARPAASEPAETALAPAAPAPEKAPPQAAPRWTGAVPEELRRPRREEAPVYPRDAVIGELGQGDADDGSYRYVRAVLYDLVMQKKGSAALKELDAGVLADMFEKLARVAPRKYRVGGGMTEPDGGVSFMFRFLGRENETSGSIYVIADSAGAIRLDDVIMNDVAPAGSARDSWDYDYLPYERFY